MFAGCELLTHELHAESDMCSGLLKFNLKILVPLGAMNRFIQNLQVAELGAREKTNDEVGWARARLCSPRPLSSNPVFKSNVFQG